MIKQYYNQVIEALTKERDEKISKIGQLTNANLGLINSFSTDVDEEKLVNFEIELSKIVKGVRDTGIHIKELQKIKYDFDEVVLAHCKPKPQPSADMTIK